MTEDQIDAYRSGYESKVEQNPEVKRILLATGDLILKADHTQAAGVSPAWLYNVIWMDVRAELQASAR